MKADHNETMSQAISLKDVSFVYEGYEQKVLDGATMEVSYGELALLSGYSGEGKSTLLSILCGIIPNITPGMITGEVLIDGESIEGKSLSEVCRKVGVVLQNAEAQIIYQNVEDEIAFGCENFAFSKEQIGQKIAQACRQMKLETTWETRTLSGGQKQRLMTACTLATGQKILIFDEPLANLDKEGAQLLMETLKDLTGKGYAVLLVEHRIDRVLPYADSVWRIAEGKTKRIADLSAQTETITDRRPSGKAEGKAFGIKNVSFRASGREILKEVNLDIFKGERLLLLGENGCGKTTFLRLLAGLSKPTEGSIFQYINPKTSAQVKPDKQWFSRVGVVYQNPDYQLFMSTVRDEIAYAAKEEAFAEEMMERFGLSTFAERHPHSLSEGQKRRLSIAAVLACKPEVLLLDEPTVGQDYDGLCSLIKILNDLQEEWRMTMILVTHDKRCAESLCDRAVLIADGGIKTIGSPSFVRRYFADQTV